MTWWWRNCFKASIHSLRSILFVTSKLVSQFHHIKISFSACACLKNLVTERSKHWQLMNQSCDTGYVLYKNVWVSEFLPNTRTWKIIQELSILTTPSHQIQNHQVQWLQLSLSDKLSKTILEISTTKIPFELFYY